MGEERIGVKPDRWAKRLMLGTSIIAMASVSHGAIAQELDDAASSAEIEEVIITGIRGSLKRSMDIKRDGQGVVDAISAEDIGKFPDTNLAESLQRITGVSIDRSNGEGSTVTVRGFGPEFNLVTLNGRQMPTSSLGDGASAPSSRSFDFANLASENIAGVEVFKTTRAANPSGGIGSTINIRTTRPLDAPGFKASIGSKALIDTSRNSGASVTPEVSGIVSQTFADDRIGISITGSYQKRKASVNSANVGWRDGYLGSENNWGSLAQEGDPRFANITNRPGPNDVYAVPQNAEYALTDIDRERINAQAVLQYRPIDSVTATLDYTLSQNIVEARTSSVGVWFNHGDTTSAWSDGPVAAPLFYSENFGTAFSDLSYSGALTENKSLNKSIGFNLEWEATDRLNLFFDFHNSSARSGANNPYGTNVAVGTAVFGLIDQTVNFENDLPIISYTSDSTFDVEDPAQRFATGNAFRNAFQRTEIEQYRIGGSYDVDTSFIESIDFGATRIENKVRSAFGLIQNDTWGGVGSAADIPDDIFTLETIADKFKGISGVDDPNLTQTFLSFDFERLVDLLDNQFGICGGDGVCLDEFTTDRRLNETTWAGFIQVNSSFDIADRPVNVTAGIRYEDTSIDSSALVPIPIGTQWVAVNEFGVIFSDDQDFTSLQGGYDHWLPAIDVNAEVIDNVIIRASYSQSLTKPGYNNLEGGQTLNGLFRIGTGDASRGDPGLLPFESDNYDASIEWYYDEASYVSVGYFRKEVENFIASNIVQETLFDLPHPGLGARVDAARAALGPDANLADIRQWIFDNADPSTFEVTGTDALGFTTGNIFGVAGEDPSVVFDVNVPVNSDETATLKGWEFALQHNFWDTGFGVILNYTIVNGDVRYDNTLPASATQFTLTGLSDSANVIGFFDKYGFQARIAWNWRDEFLQGNGPNPTYVEKYGQIDVNASYEVLDGLSVFFEGINVTGKQRRGHRRSDNNVTFVQPGDARYAVGMRYTF